MLAALLAGGSGAGAQQATPERSGWQVTCAAGGKCELGYTQRREGQLVTRLLIYAVGKKTVLEYLVPLGVNLQKGVLLQIDGRPAFATQSLYCEAPGCVGFTPLSPDLLAQMKRGALLKLAFSPRGGGTYYAFDYALDGFSARYAAFLAGKMPAAAPPRSEAATQSRPATGAKMPAKTGKP